MRLVVDTPRGLDVHDHGMEGGREDQLNILLVSFHDMVDGYGESSIDGGDIFVWNHRTALSDLRRER